MALRLFHLLVLGHVIHSSIHLSIAFSPPYCYLKPVESSLLNPTKIMAYQPPSNNNKKKTRLYQFEEARKIARGHGFESKQEFLAYDCAGAYQLPKNADQVWSEEWTSWEDFLGVPLSFAEGRQVARKLNLESKEEYLKLLESKTIKDSDLASRLPYRPDLRYKQEWQGWDDWLGINE